MKTIEAICIRGFRCTGRIRSPLPALARLALAAVVTLAAGAAAGQSFPVKPIRVVIPYSAGGLTDVATRLVATHMRDSIGQSVVVENRPGASAVIGSDVVAKAPGDGYTLLMTSISHTVISSMIPNLPFDPQKDFAPVALVASAPSVAVTSPGNPFRTLPELIGYAKANPGKVTYASAGNGTLGHLLGEWVRTAAQVDIVHVPYKGESGAIVDVMSGQVSLIIGTLTSTLPKVKGGTLRALAITTEKRSSFLPETPTMIEAGFPGFVSASWIGMLAPAGTPREVVMKLNAEVNKALQKPEVKQGLEGLGTVAEGDSPERFAAFLDNERNRWSKLIKQAGIRNE